MTDSIGSSGYRDYYTNYYSDAVGDTGNTSGTGGTYSAVFTDKQNGVTVDDFLSLMVAQLKNQDFMNPVDDTQFVTQMAQFATMQQMQEMAEYMKTNYVLSLVGQEVTAARFTVSGALEKETGTIQRISIVDNEFSVYVNGKKFSLAQIMEYHDKTTAETQLPEDGGDDQGGDGQET